MVDVVSEVLQTIEKRGLAAPPRALPFQTGPSEEQPKDNRSKLLQEIINTERVYIDGLTELNVCY